MRTNRALSIVFSEFFWDGVKAAGVPRVAAQQSPDGKDGASQRAESFDRGQGVSGAGRMEAAMLSQPGADQIPVELDEEEEQGLHCFTRRSQCLCNARNKVSWSA